MGYPIYGIKIQVVRDPRPDPLSDFGQLVLMKNGASCFTCNWHTIPWVDTAHWKDMRGPGGQADLVFEPGVDHWVFPPFVTAVYILIEPDLESHMHAVRWVVCVPRPKVEQ